MAKLIEIGGHPVGVLQTTKLVWKPECLVLEVLLSRKPFPFLPITS